jgi:hypothetical protein
MAFGKTVRNFEIAALNKALLVQPAKKDGPVFARTDSDEAPAKKATSGRAGNACACETSGHVVATPPMSVMNCRRPHVRLCKPRAKPYQYH